MRFLLDTNVVSELMRISPRPKVLRQLSLHEGHSAIASITWHELRFGTERLPAGARRDAFEEALETLRERFPILEYDASAADWHARERARLLAIGRTEQLFDGQIAAIAATRQLTLVTANAKDFKKYGGLSVVSWAR